MAQVSQFSKFWVRKIGLVYIGAALRAAPI
jgi:hypothetical protein